MSNTTFFLDERVRITASLITVDGVNYAVSGIQQAKLAEAPPDHQKVWALLIAGVTCLLIAAVPLLIMLATFSTKTSLTTLTLEIIFIIFTTLIGLAFLVAARKTITDRRPRYILKLVTAQGETTALSSRDNVYVGQIAAAIHRAILN
jgi:cytochrome bd-type quinol oxidase subunit 1